MMQAYFTVSTAAAAATAGREDGGYRVVDRQAACFVYQCLLEVMIPAYHGVSSKSPGSGGGFRS